MPSDKDARKRKPQRDTAKEFVARLEVLAADLSAGEHAAVLREVSRLHLDNVHLRRQNLRVWSGVVIFGIVFAGIVAAAFTIFPKFRYIPTKDNTAICEVNSQGGPVIASETLLDFAREGVLASYAYDYLNYRERINDVGNRYYTDRGRKAFNESLDTSRNLERVVNGRLSLRAFATNAAQLEAEGKDGTRRFWLVQQPLTIEFYVSGSAVPTASQTFVAEVRVMEDKATYLRPKGIGIDAVLLRPWAGAK